MLTFFALLACIPILFIMTSFPFSFFFGVCVCVCVFYFLNLIGIRVFFIVLQNYEFLYIFLLLSCSTIFHEFNGTNIIFPFICV